MIESDFFAMVAAKFPALPVAYPGLVFDPVKDAPGKKWLEVQVFRNVPIDGANPDFAPLDRGILQITVCVRKGVNIAHSGGLLDIANQIRSAFPKNTQFSDGLKITATPYNLSVITEDDRIMLPVSMTYST